MAVHQSTILRMIIETRRLLIVSITVCTESQLVEWIVVMVVGG